MGRWPPPRASAARTPRPSPPCAISEEVDGVFACTRKERQISRTGTPYLTIELGDSTGTIVGRAFRDADVLAGRFERGELVRVQGRVERFRDGSCRSPSSRSRAPRARRPTRRASCRRPTATWTSWKAFSSTFRGGVRPAAEAAAGEHARRPRAARRAAPRALLGALSRPGAPGPTTPTSAACWSTRSRWRRWRWSCARCTRAWTATCC